MIKHNEPTKKYSEQEIYLKIVKLFVICIHFTSKQLIHLN